MKEEGFFMKTRSTLRSAVLRSTTTIAITAGAMLLPAGLLAQAPGATIHGHVQNPAGQAVASGEVRLSTDRSSPEKDRKYKYTFPVDANGNYKGDGVAPDDYVLFYYQDGKSVDFLDHIVVKAGEDKTADDDMTRPEFLKNLTPEERKNIEEFKKKNAATVNANKQVANLNTMLASARADQKAGNYDNAVKTMTEATAAKPDEGLLWFELGNSQLGAKKYDDSVVSYQKAVDLNAASKKPNPETAGAAYNQMGQALAKAGKGPEASAAYEKAAQAEPAKAGMYYFNEAATLYNAGNRDEAAPAADKAIAADPTKADAYYIKAQSLIAKSTVDPKSQKIVPPEGCNEAYQKYLELQPNGPHAAEIKSIVAAFDEKVVSSYKAGKKK
jgi:tetratricopeptide (TPR) repeat protein